MLFFGDSSPLWNANSEIGFKGLSDLLVAVKPKTNQSTNA